MIAAEKSVKNLTIAWNLLFPTTDNPSLEFLGDRLTGLLCLVAACVHFMMVATSRHVVDAGAWEQISLLITTSCFITWRFRGSFSVRHVDLSRQICKLVATWTCIRWLFIWTHADPQTIYIHIISGLLYIPLLLGCLKLLDVNTKIIRFITIFIAITPTLLSRQASLLNTPFSDWRLGVSLAGFYVVFSYLLTSILQLKKKILRLTETNFKLEQDAITDSLTQLLNRRGFEDRRQSSQYKNYGIIILDIDHFKSVNDQFGHDIGDLVLSTVASVIKRTTRSNDLVCRWGGEEFLVAVALKENGSDSNSFLFQMATKILKSIRNTDWSAIQIELKTVTVSAGIIVTSKKSNFQHALVAADHALLEAKRAGRDRVKVGSISYE